MKHLQYIEPATGRFYCILLYLDMSPVYLTMDISILIQYIISGRNSAHSSLGIDQYCLKDGLSFRHLYWSGVLRRRSRRFWFICRIIRRISIRYFNLNLLSSAVLSGWRGHCRCIFDRKFNGIWFFHRKAWNARLIYCYCIDRCVSLFNLNRTIVLMAACGWLLLVLRIIYLISRFCRQF